MNIDIKKYLPEKGETVVTGVSGGADSVCLLVLLAEEAEKRGFKIEAVHGNHGIRGEEADRDEKSVVSLAERLDGGRGIISLTIFHEDVKDFSEKEGLGLEEAGRIIRYRRFAEVCRDKGAAKLYIAHNLNDRAETLIFNLLRGSSLAGLAGIRPESYTSDLDCDTEGFRIIRPLIGTDRKKIEEFLKERGIAFRTDGTNNEDDHTRNRIRHHVLPYLTEAVNIQAIEHMAALSVTAGETVDFVKNEAARRLFPYLTETEEASGEGFRIGRAFFDEDPVIIRAGLMQVLEALNGPRRDVGRCHLEAVIDLGRGPCGRHLDLPGFMADRTREGLILKKVSKEEVRRHLGR